MSFNCAANCDENMIKSEETIGLILHEYILKKSFQMITWKTRKHSSRMRTARLPTKCVFGLGGMGVGPRVNKFEQDLQWWLPDVSSRGMPSGLCARVCVGGGG